MVEIIGSSHLFKSLDEEGRASLLECGVVRTYNAGDVLFAQGQPGEEMLLIMGGNVKVETCSPGGKLKPLAELGRGACIGEVAVLTGDPRTATVTALDDVDAAAFAAHRIQRVLEDYPKVRRILESLVDARARDTIEKIIGEG